MKYDFKKLAEGEEKAALDALKQFVSINSIYDEKTATKENPFGLGVRKGLDFVADLGQKLGFKVDRCDHYATELSFGEGRLVDIYAHADVVPVSPNWETDPFYPTIKDNILYCRGSADDKGPGIAALYAAKIMKDLGEIKGYKLRIIFGETKREAHCALSIISKRCIKTILSSAFRPMPTIL
jgi:acetylornithine deacetylase/succinyl-diaminopimelate desuccinylase-like protein